MKDSLSKEMQEIKELIGSDAFLKLIYAFGGSNVVFPTIKTVKYLEQREKAIQLLKNGYSINETARLTGIHQRVLYRIKKDMEL